MSQEYAESRIREALKQARGNTTKARQTIIAWAAEDQRLLLALARPHMTGIVAHAISRVLSRPEIPAQEESIPATAQSLNMAPDTFGKEILKALSSDDTPVFGLEGGSSGSPHRKKASQSHIDALKAMASKSRKK
ncbi:MAG: hypothetical protein HYU57_01835 [Micavibrio aeruginosavorus]|nr:hypothetical protein [Micavibrio aeruginosavorus]